MDKTIKVSVERLRKHPRYQKYVRSRSEFKAHDAHNAATVGDIVEIEECRPISKTKQWRLLRILRRGPSAEVVAPGIPDESAE
jgi:small subunit ribosomal protein S17